MRFVSFIPLAVLAGVALSRNGETVSSAVDTRLEACRIRMTAPEKHQWTTWWVPQGVSSSGEGPSSAHSLYWANRTEKARLRASKTTMPLDINCGSEASPEIQVSLAAMSSTEKDVPLGPGTYPIVGKGGGEVRPGQILAGVLSFKKTPYEARAGTLVLDRFDMQGVAGSFVIDGADALNGARRIRIEGTFEIPCRGGLLETACQANKARAVAVD